MKRHLLLLAGCLAPIALPADAGIQSLRSRPTTEVQDRAQSEVATLRRAARILRARGYAQESQRLIQIAEEMKPSTKSKPQAIRGSELRAKELSKRDLQDKAVRVMALEFVANSYKRAGDEANAEAMAWFAAIGRSQVNGDNAAMDPVPDAAKSGDGSIMERLTEIIRAGAAVQERLGNDEAARLHAALAEYYDQRSRGKSEAEEPAPPSEENDLTYIEGRLPALRVAERAYSLDVSMTPDARRSGAQRMAWMVALARLRVEGDGVELPSISEAGPIDMDSLIGSIRLAGELHAIADDADSAKRCFELAEYYARREAGEAVDNSREQRSGPIGFSGTNEPPAEPVKGSTKAAKQDRERRQTLELRRRLLEERIGVVRQRLEAAKAELEAIRAGAGR